LATFKDFEKFKTLMNTNDPLKLNWIKLAEIEIELVRMQDPFILDPKSTAGSATSFKKTHKYKELFNWALKFIEVARASQEVFDLKKQVIVANQQKAKLDIQIAHITTLKEDMKVFHSDTLSEDVEKL